MRKIVTVICCIVLLASCSPKMLTIESIEKPDLSKLSSPQSEITFNIRIKNPNALGFRLVKSTLDVNVNNIAAGFVGINKKLKIKANATTTVPVTLKLDNSKLLTIGAMSLFSDPVLQLSGQIKARKFLFTKKYAVDYKESFSIQDFIK